MTAHTHLNVHIHRDGGVATTRLIAATTTDAFWSIDLPNAKYGTGVTFLLDSSYTAEEVQSFADILTGFMAPLRTEEPIAAVHS